MKKITPVLLLFGLTSCSGTSVLLIPDPTGKVGEVVMENKAGTQTLTKSNQIAEVGKVDKKPDDPEILTPREVNSKYSDIIVKEPRYPKRYNELKFASGSAEISPEYNLYLNEIVATAQKLLSCDIVVVGHSDTTGSNKDNKTLSLKRAVNIRNTLINLGISEKCIENPPRFYGESDLLVQTPDETDEPRNRRVEVEIR